MGGRRQVDFGPIGQERGVAEAGEVWKGNWSLEDRVSSSLSKTVGTWQARAGARFRQVPSSHPRQRGQAEPRSG